MFRDLRMKIKRHFSAIVAAAKFKLSHARSEATNNKIKLIIRTAFGFRNVDLWLCSLALTFVPYFRADDLPTQITEAPVFVIVGNHLISLSGANCGKTCKIDCGVKILKDADLGFAGEILQLKFGFEGIIGCLNTPAFEIQLRGLIQRKLIWVQICQQSFDFTVRKNSFQYTDRIILTLMGQRDPILGCYGVYLQIPLFPYPHDEENLR